MSLDEWIIVIVGLFFGYWAVSAYINRKESSSESSSHRQSQGGSKGENNEKASGGDAWYEVLEVSESSSIDEITNSYKKKIRQYHPDKVESLGSELKKLAEKKSKEINAAYNIAKRLKKGL
jgi:DnaJ like chaperone protein